MCRKPKTGITFQRSLCLRAAATRIEMPKLRESSQHFEEVTRPLKGRLICSAELWLLGRALKYTNRRTYHSSNVHTALLNVARVQPGTSEGITDLLLPQPSSGLKKVYSQQSPEFIHIRKQSLNCLVQ